MIILPAIDLRGGKCVRLHQGDYAQETVYGEDPVAMAQSFRKAGAEWIHIVDLDGAKAGELVNHQVIEGIISTGLNTEWGGGVRAISTIQELLCRGISRVILGSKIIKDRGFAEEALGLFGDRIVAGLDVRDRKVAISGWQDQTDLDLFSTAEWLIGLGCIRFVVTDISTDGTLQGPNLALAREFTTAFPGTKYIISGGVGELSHVENARQTEAEGLIVGKAIYDGRIIATELF